MNLKSIILNKLAIRKNVHTGIRFHVGPRSVIWAPRRLQIGNDVYVGKNVTIEVDGTIGDGVLIANSVGIVGKLDHDITDIGTVIRNARWVGDHPDDLSLPVTIGSDVWIGYGAVVLSGVTVGDSAVIAAGSVVTADVPKNSIVAGNPAKVIRERYSPEEYAKHTQILKEKGVLLTENLGGQQ